MHARSMIIQFITLLCTIQILTEKCRCGEFMDLPSDSGEPDLINQPLNREKSLTNDQNLMVLKTNSNNPSIFEQHKENLGRNQIVSRRMRRENNAEDLRDNIVFKTILSGLVEQSVLDGNRSLHSLNNIRNPIKNEVPYQIGFITRYIRRQRDLMNDFFDMAIKYRKNVLILQQMNVFEHIMHTSVNITNLVTRLVSLHVKHKNSNKQTSPATPHLPDETETTPKTERRLFPLRTQETSRKPPYNNFDQKIKGP